MDYWSGATNFIANVDIQHEVIFSSNSRVFSPYRVKLVMGKYPNVLDNLYAGHRVATKDRVTNSG